MGEHQRNFERRRLAEGCLRLPGVVLGYEASDALRKLYEAGWEPSKSRCIERALIDAARGVDMPRGR